MGGGGPAAGASLGGDLVGGASLDAEAHADRQGGVVGPRQRHPCVEGGRRRPSQVPGAVREGSEGSNPLADPGAGEPPPPPRTRIDGRPLGSGTRSSADLAITSGNRENPLPRGSSQMLTGLLDLVWWWGKTESGSRAVARAMLPGMAGITTKFPCATSGAGVGVFSW